MGLFSSIGNALGSVVGDVTGSTAEGDIVGGLQAGQGAVANGLNQASNMIAPTAQIGTNSINNLNSILNNGNMSNFYNNPAYQYALQQSTRGLNATAAAQGTLMSGNTLKALQTNASGLASQNYNSYISNLSNLFNQTSPYLQQFNQIPYLQGQNAAGFDSAIGGAKANQANQEGGLILGGLSGILGGGGSPVGSSALGSAGTSPWGTTLSNTGVSAGGAGGGSGGGFSLSSLLSLLGPAVAAA